MYKPLDPIFGVFDFSRISSAFYHIYQIAKATTKIENQHSLTTIKSNRIKDMQKFATNSPNQQKHASMILCYMKKEEMPNQPECNLLLSIVPTCDPSSC